MLKAISQILFGKDRSLSDVVSTAKACGYAGVEICLIPGGDFDMGSTEQDYGRIRSLCDDAGLALTSILPLGGGAFTADDEPTRRQAHDVFEKCIEAASALGIAHILCVPGRVTPEVRYDVALDRARQGLAALAPVAEDAGVFLCVENVWNKMLMSPTETRDFIDSIGSPAIGAFLDVGNMLIWGYPEQWVAILGDRVMRVHFKDFRRDGYEFVQLMDGDVDWQAVMKELLDIGYDGPVISEVGSTDEEFAESSRRMDMILSMA